MKRLTLFVALLISAGLLNAQDGASIMNSAKNRVQADTISSRSRMVITAKDGNTMNG
jgi:hypothetical protein